MPSNDYVEQEEIDDEEELANEEDELDRGDDIEDEDEEDEDVDTEVEDEEDEGDEETEESDEDDEDDSEAEEKDEPRIPKSRLDQVLAQRDQERERTQWLEDQLEKMIDKGPAQQETVEPEVDPFDYDAAEVKYGELLLEGESGKAAQVRNLINRSRQEDMEAMIAKITTDVTTKANTHSTETVETSKFNDLVESYEGLYPFLDSNSEEHDEGKVEMVNTLLAGYVAQGKSKRDALKLAVKTVVPNKPAKKEKAALGNSRAKESRKKKADTSNRQPPKTRSSKMKSADLDEVIVSKLSERDYNRLSMRERKILRGD